MASRTYFYSILERTILSTLCIDDKPIRTALRTSSATVQPDFRGPHSNYINAKMLEKINCFSTSRCFNVLNFHRRTCDNYLPLLMLLLQKCLKHRRNISNKVLARKIKNGVKHLASKDEGIRPRKVLRRPREPTWAFHYCRHLKNNNLTMTDINTMETVWLLFRYGIYLTVPHQYPTHPTKI